MEPVVVGITSGDINGIGLEVTLRALSDARIYKHCTPVIFASPPVVKQVAREMKIEGLKFHVCEDIEDLDEDSLNIFSCWADAPQITWGALNETGGRYAKLSLESATEALRAGDIDALVTAPIHKKAMQLAGFEYPGHTEYLSKIFDAPRSLMILLHDNLRVALATGHQPLSEVTRTLNKERIVNKLLALRDSMVSDFDIEMPRIAVLGLNPHAGDEGLLGNEEQTIIRPAINEVQGKNMLAFGPYPADGFFGSGAWKKFDAVLSMYHDQGLVGFKTIAFGDGVNYTAGLPFVRTSPDHGTGFDIAGQGKADAGSMLQALFAAVNIFKQRYNYELDRANPIARLTKSKAKGH